MKTTSPSNVKDTDFSSADAETSSFRSYVNKEEKTYQRLLIEQREQQQKKSNIEKRLLQIQNNLNKRREEIRSGKY